MPLHGPNTYMSSTIYGSGATANGNWRDAFPWDRGGQIYGWFPVTFYGSKLYLGHCSASAEVFDVPPWGIGVLARSVPGTARRDAAGAYPLTCLDDSADIARGLEMLRAAGFVSFVGVLDATCAPEIIAARFPVRRPFKLHFLVRDPKSAFRPSPQHRLHIKKARRCCSFRVGPLRPWLSDWAELYRSTAAARGWTNVHRFPDEHWSDLAQATQVTAFRADIGDDLGAMSLFVHDGPRAFYHLGVSTAAGYQVHASYGLMAEAIEHYSELDLVDLGGSAGLSDAQDGLTQFKRGFANDRATAWLVGAILDDAAYRALSRATTSEYFPAYRGPRDHE